MKNEFTNRLGMFQTSIGILQDPKRQPLWFQQNPVIFTTKVATAAAGVIALEQFCQQQGIIPTGPAADKMRVEKALDASAHSLARALVTWFTDKNDLTNAAKVDFAPSDWLRFRDEVLLAKARVVRDLGNTVVADPAATDAPKYDITAASVKVVDDGITAYDKFITAPQQAQSDRHSLTNQLRTRFNAVEDLFVQIDDMILRFNGTDAGQAMIAAYKAARIIRNYGHGPGTATPTPAPTTTTTPAATPAPATKP
jgi:hypothetical protein